MKYLDEFRDPEKAKALIGEIERLVAEIETARRRPLQIMEVCGGHTHSIFRYGIEEMLPDAIELVHGPGCPVCVLPMGRVDDCLALAEQPDVIFTTFGDALRVPGSKKSLLQAKAEGADVRIVYSPLDALELARKHPEREVIFFGLGFGSDINGLHAQPRPRSDAADNPVRYPFRSFDGGSVIDRQRSDTRTYDINTDGVDHYGLYADWVEDLRLVAGQQIVDDLASGAEAYLRLWERAEEAAD